MSRYTQILYQIVYSTKYREHTLVKKGRDELFAYLTKLLQNKKCFVYQIGGVENHLHIVTALHATVSLAALVKDLKLASTHFIKSNQLFPAFNGWQDGYSAFTYSIDSKANLVNYVKNQEAHHRLRSFEKELIKLLNNHQIVYDEKYLFL